MQGGIRPQALEDRAQLGRPEQPPAKLAELGVDPLCLVAADAS